MAKLTKGLFVYPYRIDPWVQFGKIPPIGLEIVAASVKDLFSSIDVIDMRFEDNLMKYLEGTDVVCLSMPWGREKGVAGGISKGYDVDYIYELIQKIPDNKTLVIGGTFASESADYLLKNFPNIDIVVNGQGEETLREFLTSGSTHNIKGIFYRNNGKVVRAKEREPNIIPFLYPDRQLRKYKYYLLGNQIDCMYTSHGCPHRCVYCEFEGSKWNNRSADDMFQEIKSMDKDVKFILINDNNFFENTQRAEKFIDLLNEHKIRKTFWAQARSQPLAKRKDLVSKLNTAGFILAIGVESPQDHVLKWLKKGYMRSINDEAFENMKKTSIVIQAYYIIGNYKETRDEILSITDYSHDNWIDFICLNRLRCYPQSKLAGMIDKLDGIYVDKSDLRVYTDEVKKNELTKLCKTIVNQFYLSRTIWRTLCKLSFLMNVPAVFRYFIFSLFNLFLFKRNRKMIKLTDALFRFNIFLPFDLLLNYSLRFLGRLVYGIKPR